MHSNRRCEKWVGPMLLAAMMIATKAMADDPPADNYGCFKGDKTSEFCFVAGAIAIPFRYVLSGNKDVLGGISGDLFAGANLTVPGFPNGITLLGYLGYLPSFNSTTASSGKASNTQSTSSSSNNSTGGALDSGIGIALPVKMGSTHSHVGIVAGTDHTGKSNNYAYNGKWYTSVLIGFTF